VGTRTAGRAVEALSRADWLIKRSLSVSGHRTSIALEAEFWLALEALAVREGVTLPALIARIDADREQRPLASALRVHALKEIAK